MRISNFERAALEKLLAGEHPVLACLRVQAKGARVVSRDLTSSGFCLELDVPANIPQLPGPTSDFRLDDVWAKIDKLKWGAGLVLTVSAGRLDLLEGYSIGEPWPREIGWFELIYEWEPRLLPLPDALSDKHRAMDRPLFASDYDPATTAGHGGLGLQEGKP